MLKKWAVPNWCCKCLISLENSTHVADLGFCQIFEQKKAVDSQKYCKNSHILQNPVPT
jgi:hypothetical protein